MPFAGYADFYACVAANQDKRSPEAFCAELQRKTEGSGPPSVGSLPRPPRRKSKKSTTRSTKR